MDIIEEEVSNVRNGINIETLSCIKDGLRRLAKIYYWPAESGESPDFNALCEFVIFNVGIKRPFFEKLLGRLLNRVGNLGHFLLNSIDDDTPQITYEEAYVLLRKLRLNNTRDLLNNFSCSSNMFNGILKSIKTLDYDLFLSSLHESDNKKTMQVLWEMRYILYGIDQYVTNIEPTGQIKVVNRWLDGQSYNYSQYFYHYTQLLDLMPCEEEVENQFVKNRLKEIIGIPLKPTRRSIELFDFGIDKQIVLVGNYFPSWLDELKEIDDVNEFIKYLKSDMAWITSRAGSVAKSILTRNVISHSKEIADEFNYDYSVLDEETMNSLDPIDEDDMEILRNYIILYTNEMLYIFNKVENILDDDSKRVLKSILYSSRYTALLESLIFSSASQKTDELQNADNETIESFIPTPIVHEMTESAKKDNNVSNRNDINAIVLHLPRLLEKYHDKYCASMANRCEGCTKEMIEYYLWGANEIPQNAISKDKPLVWLGSRQLLVAYIRFLYLVSDSKQRILPATKKRLESSVIIDGKSLQYVSISPKTLEKDINGIKMDIDWNEEDNKKEIVVKHEKFR